MREEKDVLELRERIVSSPSLPAGERGALVALLGSVERAQQLVERIEVERASVDRGTIGVVEPVASA
ncbi:hypothetical protein GCM10027030_23680 [Luteococcus sediminum]